MAKKKVVKKTSTATNILSTLKKVAPLAIRPGISGVTEALRYAPKKQGLVRAKTATTKAAKMSITQSKQYETAIEHAASGEIPFDEAYWRKQAEATWGSYTANQLANIAKESNFAKKGAKQNLDLALERIAQDRAFAGEDLSGSLKELAAQRKWNQQEFDETLANINRMRQYLGEDFENSVQELAYQRGLNREQIAQNIMPLAESVREQAWERGLGAKGLGGREAGTLEAARAQQIRRGAETEAIGQKAAGIVKTRGLEEQTAGESQAKRILGQRGENIGLQQNAANRAYRQALARYGLEEKEARIGYGQTVGGQDIAAQRAQQEAQQAGKIGIEEFVQARKGEAYTKAAAYPELGVRQVQTQTPIKTLPRITTPAPKKTVAVKKKTPSPSLLQRVGGFLRRVF